MFGSQLHNNRTTWEAVEATVKKMEEGRWTSAWVYDHFLPPFSRTAEVMEHDLHDTFEGWSLLCGMAAVTDRLLLGVLVTGNTYRNPALLAKMAATLDHISNGRAILGIGAGWNVREHEAYSWRFPSMQERQDRLEEACELIKKLFLANGLIDYEGKHYQLSQAPFAPKCVQKPHVPIMVGGRGEKRTLRTLAKYGDIMNVICGPDEVVRLGEVLAGHCEAIGRDPAEIQRTAHVPMRVENDPDRAAKIRGDRDWAMIGTRDEVIQKTQAFIDAGITEFTLQAIPNRPEIYAELDSEVLSAFD
ncbi:MAG: TIGR03560 family F420-dependent LLM class oxidoreductase [Acidobacteriota bacterium]|nr:TIGR03560 family F420-dependent LLM class oxidoreductase [Acidobacteriota bacterium]